MKNENKDKCQMSSTEIRYFWPYQYWKFASQLDFAFSFKDVLLNAAFSIDVNVKRLAFRKRYVFVKYLLYRLMYTSMFRTFVFH